MKTIQEIIKVMQHFANGGEVECRTARDWFTAPNPSWNWGSADYRIKQPVDPYAELKALTTDDDIVKTAHLHQARTTQRVIHTIAQQLGLNESEITPTSTFDELNIDSLDLLEATMALEDAFGVEIEDDDTFKWLTVGDAIEYLKALP